MAQPARALDRKTEADKPESAADWLRRFVTVNPHTGEIAWNVSRGCIRAGELAGSVRADRYCLVRIDGRRYLAHRLVWLWVTGEWPKGEIDHINRDPSDNRFINLRIASHSDNMHNTTRPRNNTSGVKGVCWDKATRSWMAKISVDGRQISLGRFSSIDDAANARAKAAADIHGAFASAG